LKEKLKAFISLLMGALFLVVVFLFILGWIVVVYFVITGG